MIGEDMAVGEVHELKTNEYGKVSTVLIIHIDEHTRR